MGRRGGAYVDVHPVDLLSAVLRDLFDRTGLDAALVDDHIAGCVSQVGDQSLNVARNAWLAAGLPEIVPSTTVDRQCGSSQQAIHFAAQGIMAGANDLVVASGLEHMTRVPLGSSMSSGNTFPPSLSVRYEGKLVPQGISAELIASRWQISDAAAAVLVASAERAEELGLRPRARLVSFAVVGDDPVLMLTGPIPATRMVLDRAGLELEDVEVAEINEAFASVVLAWKRELEIPEVWFDEHVNPNGGAIAMGHPVGASGARLMADLVAELERREGRYGLQVMCEGGGMANATVLERIP